MGLLIPECIRTPHSPGLRMVDQDSAVRRRQARSSIEPALASQCEGPRGTWRIYRDDDGLRRIARPAPTRAERIDADSAQHRLQAGRRRSSRSMTRQGYGDVAAGRYGLLSLSPDDG